MKGEQEDHHHLHRCLHLKWIKWWSPHHFFKKYKRSDWGVCEYWWRTYDTTSTTKLRHRHSTYDCDDGKLDSHGKSLSRLISRKHVSQCWRTRRKRKWREDAVESLFFRVVSSHGFRRRRLSWLSYGYVILFGSLWVNGGCSLRSDFSLRSPSCPSSSCVERKRILLITENPFPRIIISVAPLVHPVWAVSLEEGTLSSESRTTGRSFFLSWQLRWHGNIHFHVFCVFLLNKCHSNNL